MDSVFDRPQRPTVANAEWFVTAQLIRDGNVIEQSAVPLKLSDSWFNDRKVPDRLGEAGRNIAKWIDQLAYRRARHEAAATKAARR